MDTNSTVTPRFFWFGEQSEICAAADFDQALEFSCYDFEEDQPRDDQWGELPADHPLTIRETDEDDRPLYDEPTTKPLVEWYEPGTGLPQMICTAYA
jgi:hypothetical protein